MMRNKNRLIKRGLMALFVAVLIIVFFAVKNSRSQTMPYYSGDAVSYQDKVVFGSANSGYLEIFVLENKNVRRAMKIKYYNPTANDYRDFSDLKFSVENGSLYVYAVSEYTLVKYNFSDLQNLALVTKQTNTYWDWYYRVDQIGDGIGTVSSAGVKTISPALQIIDSFNFYPSDRYSLRSNDSRSLLFGINDSYIQIYDRNNRAVTLEIPLNFNSDTHGRRTYYDSVTNQLYAVDDYYFKKYSMDGRLLGSFKHLSAPGYDAESTLNSSVVYFSNGQGVVKMHKDDFKLAGYAFTTNLGGPQGWAMGLKAVNTNQGDVLVVFNNTNILVLDKNLHKLASVRAEEIASAQVLENLYLNLDHSVGTSGAAVNLTGGGYLPNETLEINFGGRQITNAAANQQGRFNLNLTVPSVSSHEILPKKVDIKVNGLDSGMTYSISFTIQ